MSTPQYSKWYHRPWVAAMLALAGTLLCLIPLTEAGWVNYDDPSYVLDNPMIKDLSKIGELFTTLEVQGIYHPLTLLSLSIDYAIAGADPLLFHWTNLILHGINVVFVFLFTRKLSQKLSIAFLTALIFGLHPMHVESVAWISSRKDVLYGFFFLGGLVSYQFWLDRDSGKKAGFYIMTLALFILALLAKPMAIVFPLLLLLVDWMYGRRWDRGALLEKLPFFGLSLVFGIIGILAQQAGAAMGSIERYPFHITVLTGIHNLAVYLIKAFIPHHLSAFHPYPAYIPDQLPWTYYASVVPWLLLIGFFLFLSKHAKTLLFGLGFAIICLGPVLQILPFGRAIIAERYTYIAYIGLGYLLGSGYVYLREHLPGSFWPEALKWLLAGYLLWMGNMTFQRCDVWSNGATLWSDVIDKYPDHYFGYNGLGEYLSREKRYDEAVTAFSKSIDLDPDHSEVFNNRGRSFQFQGNYDFSLMDYDNAIRLAPDNDIAWLNRGILKFTAFGDTGAIDDLHQAIVLNPENSRAWLNRGVFHERSGRPQLAESDYSRAIETDPESGVAFKYRGLIRLTLNNPNGALEDLNRALRLEPSNGQYYYWRSRANLAAGNPQQALDDAHLAKGYGFAVEKAYLEKLEALMRERE